MRGIANAGEQPRPQRLVILLGRAAVEAGRLDRRARIDARDRRDEAQHGADRRVAGDAARDLFDRDAGGAEAQRDRFRL